MVTIKPQHLQNLFLCTYFRVRDATEFQTNIKLSIHSATNVIVCVLVKYAYLKTKQNNSHYSKPRMQTVQIVNAFCIMKLKSRNYPQNSHDKGKSLKAEVNSFLVNLCAMYTLKN